MKILHYINNLGSGGAERLLTFILPIMKDYDHEMHLAVSNHNASVDKFVEQIEDAGIPIHNFNVSTFDPRNLTKLINLHREHEFDLIHAHLFPTQYWLAFANILNLQKPPVKLVKTEHNVTNNRRKFKVLKPLEYLVYNQFNKFITISPSVHEELNNWIKIYDKSELIHNGVAIRDINLAKSKLDDPEYDFIKSENINLLMVGRFNGSAKDQFTLIKSLQYLPLNYHLYLAGVGELQHNAEQLVSELNLKDRVHFLGMRTDVYTLMHKVDLNILSSYFEGLSGVTLESLASSTPFIGTNSPGIREIVPSDSFLFPPNDPQSLAQKIREVTSSQELSNEMVKKANMYVKQYNIDFMAQKYLELYNSLEK